jgi:hypothetical protein
MTLRLFESIRRHGGRFATCPLYAVTPRIGAPLLKSTRQSYDKLKVTYLRRTVKDAYAWYAYGNKLKALALVEDQSKAELLAFLDGDTLVSEEPSEIVLSPNEDFAACSLDNPGELEGESSTIVEGFWHDVCDIVGLDPKVVPRVLADSQHNRRPHFNAGVFVYRRNTLLGARAMSALSAMLSARISHRANGVHSFDEIALVAVIFKCALRWRILGDSHNVSLPSWCSKGYESDLYRNAKVLHYHTAMQPANWEPFLSCLKVCHPRLDLWLSKLGPIVDRTPGSFRLASKTLRLVRSVRRRRHLRACRCLA